jgi:hypothetical protein
MRNPDLIIARPDFERYELTDGGKRKYNAFLVAPFNSAE